MQVVREYGDTMDIDTLHMADETRHDTYDRQITEDERVSFGEEVVQLSNKILDDQDEKKAQAKMLGDQIKANEARRKDVARILKRGTVTTDTKVSTFFDRATLKVHEYNSLGERILTRKMRPDERAKYTQYAIE